MSFSVRAMAFVPPDNLPRLVRQYYRQKSLPFPRNVTFSKNSFLFALYECDDGYEFVDEVNSMFCNNRQWVITPPECRGKGNSACFNDSKIRKKLLRFRSCQMFVTTNEIFAYNSELNVLYPRAYSHW